VFYVFIVVALGLIFLPAPHFRRRSNQSPSHLRYFLVQNTLNETRSGIRDHHFSGGKGGSRCAPLTDAPLPYRAAPGRWSFYGHEQWPDVTQQTNEGTFVLLS